MKFSRPHLAAFFAIVSFSSVASPAEGHSLRADTKAVVQAASPGAAVTDRSVDRNVDAETVPSSNEHTKATTGVDPEAAVQAKASAANGASADDGTDIEAAIQAATSNYDHLDRINVADSKTFASFKARMLKKNPAINERTLQNCWSENPSAAFHPVYSAGWPGGFCRYTTDCNSPSYSTELECCKVSCYSKSLFLYMMILAGADR